MNWFDCLLAFKKVAEQQSFVGASRELSLMNSVVTKRIQWLEERLACTLLLRTTRKVILTDAGEFLLTKIMPLLDEWQDVHAQILDYQNQPRGEIAICLPPSLGAAAQFTHIFNQFLQAYPHLRLQVTTTHKPIDLIDAKIDILIAPEKYLLDPSSTIGIKLFDYNYQCFAAPSYIEQQAPLNKPQDLKDHNCILYRDDNQWEFSEEIFTVHGNFRADAGDSMIAACVSGTGIIYIPQIFVQKEIEQGLIKQVLTEYSTKKDRMMLFYVRREYKPRKQAIFIDFLRQKLKL